jgi:hypothetical protein
MPLGIDEYLILLRALQLGFGTDSVESLRRLCHTLWIKSAEERYLFDHHFDLMVGAEATLADPAPRALDRQIGTAVPADRQAEAQRAQDASSVAAPAQHGPSADASPAAQVPPFAPVLGDEIRMGQIVQAALLGPDIPRKRFILATEYFPVTRREMKQSWRHLRRMVREGPPAILNIEETIKRIGREGVFLQPVLEPSRTNRTELLLAVDQDGSMVPFHALARRLVETAARGGRLGRTGVLYFHNWPADCLYLDSALVEAQGLDALISKIHRDRTVLLVFSDAGGARGHFDRERVSRTRDFLCRLQGNVRRIAWLNPMPRQRWQGTTAGAIAELVPMFETTRRGMDDAIDVLRGRHTSLASRR